MELDWGKLWGIFQHLGGATSATYATSYNFYLWRRAKHSEVKFRASKQEQALSGFLKRILEIIWHIFLGVFEGSNKGPNLATTGEARGKSCQNSEVKIWSIPSWVFLGYCRRVRG